MNQEYNNNDNDEGHALQHEETVKLEEAWAMLPHLFNTWDTDQSGKLDKGDLLGGVERFCDSTEADFDSRMVLRLFEEVDTNSNSVLDTREFAVFIARFGETMGISLDALVDQLAEIAVQQVPPQNKTTTQARPTRRMSLLPKRTSKCEESSTAPTWAQLKEASEELYASKPSSVEKLRISLAVRKSRRIQKAAAKEAAAKAKTDNLKPVSQIKSPRRASSYPSQTPGIWQKIRQPIRRLSMTDSRTVLDEEDEDGEHLLSVDQLENFSLFDMSNTVDGSASLASFPGYTYNYEVSK